MIRKVATMVLIAAFASATTPSFACTGISLDAKDGAMIRGRTLEFGFPLSSNVIVIPAGTQMRGTLPDGKPGISYTTKYSMVGADALGLPRVVHAVAKQAISPALVAPIAGLHYHRIVLV